MYVRVGRHAAAVQVGDAERLCGRGEGRRRGTGGEPVSGVWLGDLQAMADQRDDVQFEGVRQPVRGRPERRLGGGHGHDAGKVGDVPVSAQRRPEQDADYGGKQALLAGKI